MADDKQLPGSSPLEKTKQEAGLPKKGAQKNNEVSKTFQEQLVAFIKQHTGSGQMKENKDELIGLFLVEVKTKNTELYEAFMRYITQVSGKTNPQKVTFNDLRDLPISKDGRLSAFFAERYSNHLETKKQEVVFMVREQQYAKAIASTGDKTLQEKRKNIVKKKFSQEKIGLLAKKNTLLSTLQKEFDELFSGASKTEQQTISNYLTHENNIITIGKYLDQFAKEGEDIKDKNTTDLLLKDQKITGTTKKGAMSLGQFMFSMTRASLFEHGYLGLEKSRDMQQEFDNSLFYTQITTSCFDGYPRNAYLQAKKPLLQCTAKTEREQQLFEKKILQGYLDRVHTQIQKKVKNTPRAKLLEQLAHLSKIEDNAFAEQVEILSSTISSYLQEEYLATCIDHNLIKEQFKQFNISPDHFPAYLAFWKQIFDLTTDRAMLKIGNKEYTLFVDKKLVTHPQRFTINNLDELFSFSWTIDLEKSDPLFGDLFGNTPKQYIVDEKTGQTIDTKQEHEIAVYLESSDLKNRLLLDEKSEIQVTVPTTKTTFSGFPQLNKDNDKIDLYDSQGNIVYSFDFDLSKEIDAKAIIDPKKYTITTNKRTFRHPTTPSLLIPLLQTAVFKKLTTPTDKEEGTEITTIRPPEQVDQFQDTPRQPNITEYLPARSHDDDLIDRDSATLDQEESINNKPTRNGTRKEVQVIDQPVDKDEVMAVRSPEQENPTAISKLTEYKFASTLEIPAGVKKDITSRKPPKTVDQVRAWIDQGVIYFHADYFCKKYKFESIGHEKRKLTFTLEDGSKVAITELSKIKQHPEILACIQELKSAKVHEIAHRLFHFHNIDQLHYTTKEGNNLTLDQETICEIADGQSLPRKQDNKTNKWFVEIQQDGKIHQVWLDDLEKKIATFVVGFTRGSIKRLDAKNLEAYLKDCTFTGLVAANTSGTPPTAPTTQSVQIGCQALINRLTNFIAQIDQQFDPSNQQQVALRTQAQQQLDALTQQQTTLQAGTTLTQNELDQMHQAQVATAQFIQQNNGNNNGNNGNNPNNTQQNQPNASPNQQINSQGTPLDTSESCKEFDDGFATLKGDPTAKVERGTAIFLKEHISTLPGQGFNRVKYTIKDYDDENIVFELSDASEKQVTNKVVVNKPRTQETINELKRLGKSDVYKFGKQTATKSGFMLSSKTTLGGKRTEVNDFKKTVNDKGTTRKEEITHVGVLKEKITKFESTETVVYKVDRGINSVTVSAAVPDGDKNDQKRKALRSKRMDYDTFQMFCFTKSLEPLTKTEVTRAGQRLNPKDILNEGLSRQGISLAAIRKGLKAIPEAYKKRREEEQEFQTALATDRLSNLIPDTSLFGLDEIRNDLGGTDGLVRQRIQKFKGERASTGDNDKASVHDSAITENIKASIFENIQSSRKYKYKAAGALLYVLEKEGPYMRALAEYATKDGGGQRVKCLLGEPARQQFLAERQRKIDQFKTHGGSNDQLQSEIVKFELRFIKEATTGKPGRGSKFGRAVEDGMILHGGANAIDPSSISKKGDFAYMLETFCGGGIGQNMPGVAFSALEAMKGAVEEKEHYSDFYMSIIALFATGMVHMLPKDFIDRLKGIGRSRGIPISMLAGDAHASGKAMRLLHHIAQNAGIQTFSEFSGYSLNDFDSMHIHNTSIANRKEILESFRNWRSNYGRTIMHAFNYKNEHLINIVDDDHSLTADQRKNNKIVADYLGEGGVFNGYKAFQNAESVGEVDGQTPFFEEGLLNLSEGPFRSYMMQFSQGQLKNPHSETMRGNFSRILEQFETNISTTSSDQTRQVMTKLLYKKFTAFFAGQLSGTANDKNFPPDRQGESFLNIFQSALKGEIAIEPFVRKCMFKEKERAYGRTEDSYIVHEDISNDLVKQTILQFAHLVKKYYNSIDSATYKADIFS